MARRRHRARAFTGILTASLLVVACSGGPSGSANPSAAGTGSATGTIAGIEYTAPISDPQALQHIADEERKLVEQNRERAAVAEAIGEDGQAVFEAGDTAEAEAGAQFIQDDEAQFATSSAPVASIGSHPPTTSLRPDVGLTGLAGFSAGALAITFGSEAIGRADTTLQGSVPFEPMTSQSTAGGVTTAQAMNQEMSLNVGAGQVEMDVTITSTSTMTDAASGASKGTLTETAKAHFEINACPDAGGVVSGTVTLDIETQMAGGGGGGSGATTKLSAPFRLLVNESARVYRLEMDSTSSVQASTADGDWSASATINFGFDAGPAGSGTSGTAGDITSNGATETQLKETTGAALFLPGLVLASMKDPTERFFRSGKCVEVVLVEGEGGTVDPDEHKHVVAQPRAKWGGGDLDKPVVATLSGKVSISPANSPENAPASFTYVAGHEDGDAGTVTFTSTSNRGIGTTTATYTVGGIDKLNVSFSGSLVHDNFGILDTVTISGSGQVKRQADGILRGPATAHATFARTSDIACEYSTAADVPVTIEANPLAAQTGKVIITIRGPDVHFMPLGDDCQIGDFLGNLIVGWEVGIHVQAVPDGGPAHEKTVAGTQTYEASATVTR
jgi:hypothetical protein